MTVDEVIADVTFFFRWGPLAAESLTLRELQWWEYQAARLARQGP